MILKFRNLFYDFQENQRCHYKFVDLARFIVFIDLLRVFGSLCLKYIIGRRGPFELNAVL